MNARLLLSLFEELNWVQNFERVWCGWVQHERFQFPFYFWWKRT